MVDTPNPNLHPALTHYIAWIKAHEKLLIIVLAAFLTFHFYGKVLDLWDKHDQRQTEIQKQVADTAAKKVEVDATANQQLLSQLADLKQQYALTQAQLQSVISQRTKDTNDQKKKNDASTSSEVATRIIQLLRLQPQDVTASPIDGTLVFTPSAGHADVNAIEDGVKAQADVLDLNKQVAACTTVTKKQDETISGLQVQITDEKTSHTADVKLKNDEIAQLKVEKKKAWISGFKWGAIAGFIGGVVTLHKL
ncbi:Uncharacterised protein [uncultured archaeon]|nr:Uncharacterised protein [uncultured archaeon]